MSWDPPAPLSAPPAQMNTESDKAANNVLHPAHYPNGLSFLGPLPPSCDQAIQDFNTWNRSAQGCYPSQPLQGPGNAGPPSPSPLDRPPPPVSRKRKRAIPADSAAVGGYGPIPGSPDVQTERSTPEPTPAIKFTERKNSAYEIWAFTRAIRTDEVVPAEQWLDDYGDHLTSRPDSTFVGCKFCTQFG